MLRFTSFSASVRGTQARISSLIEADSWVAAEATVPAVPAALSVSCTIVEVLDLDAAVVRMPDDRREQLVPHAVHVRDAPFAAAVRMILPQPVPFGQRNVQLLFRERRAFRLGPGSDEQFLPALVPFLDR